ncbi:MAG TPA: hypothetical protein VMH84_10475 [Xanthobacteraceae bacterium]|nr:hypothetical protein [Xanthobacteraceae bacterium]
MGRVKASIQFPFINLEKAIGRAQELYAADERGNEMSVSTAFAVWKYSEKSSGGFQTVSALKMYGLLEEGGSGKVKLTNHALDFFRDEREDRKAQRLQDFATNPPLLRELFNTWGSHVPSDTVARSHLKIERGLNEQSARAVLGIYKENIAFANVKGDGRISELAAGMGPEQGAFERGNSMQIEPRRSGSPTPNTEPVTQLPVRVVMNGNRLDIQASVDLDGLKKLRTMLDKYQGILEMMQPEPEKPKRKMRIL